MYLVMVLRCCCANPAFLLVDIAATKKQDGNHQTFMQYVLQPEKFVAQMLFNSGGLDRPGWFIPIFAISMLVDVCGMAALGAGVGAGNLPPALLVGYFVTTLGLAWFALQAVAKGIAHKKLGLFLFGLGCGFTCLIAPFLLFMAIGTWGAAPEPWEGVDALGSQAGGSEAGAAARGSAAHLPTAVAVLMLVALGAAMCWPIMWGYLGLTDSMSVDSGDLPGHRQHSMLGSTAASAVCCVLPLVIYIGCALDDEYVDTYVCSLLATLTLLCLAGYWRWQQEARANEAKRQLFKAGSHVKTPFHHDVVIVAQDARPDARPWHGDMNRVRLTQFDGAPVVNSACLLSGEDAAGLFSVKHLEMASETERQDFERRQKEGALEGAEDPRARFKRAGSQVIAAQRLGLPGDADAQRQGNGDALLHPDASGVPSPYMVIQAVKKWSRARPAGVGDERAGAPGRYASVPS
jgi:hypothetical protein